MPRLMALRALVSPGRPCTTKMPTMEASRPTDTTASGKIRPLAASWPPFRPMARKAETPRMIEATRVTAKLSNRSAAMPAQSPTLSPTLSAMVAGLRGSSSGMPASTLPTRSAPTSAALVKMPPPTRRNRASSEPPKPKPTRIDEAVFWKIMMMTVAPSRPRPAVSSPATPPVRKATWRAAPKLLSLAAAAVRTLPRTASHMPKKPMVPEKMQPTTKAMVRNDARLGVADNATAPPVLRILVEVTNTTTASGHHDHGDGAELALEVGRRRPPGWLRRSPASRRCRRPWPGRRASG